MTDDSACCGLRPHFNWIVSTCEQGDSSGTGQFCQHLPSCLLEGSPKINYVAAYQYDGANFHLMDESSVGDLSASGIAGNWHDKTGWEKLKSQWHWQGGDWTTKYAPWAKDDGPSGPRGVTPPAGMWVLSAENFYYAAFYMLTQLNLNLVGQGMPGGETCWAWELDPVEGSAGWAPGKNTPGNLNQLYSTNNAQASGCMPLPFMASQMNGFDHEFKFPEEFRDYCSKNPSTDGCQPWKDGSDVSWSGGAGGTQRFENLWDEPYVFVIVVDAKGYWSYRWRPAALGDKTGWPGIERYSAQRIVPARPQPVKDPAGLQTDVRGDVVEAVMLQPSVPPEASCLRSSIEEVNWEFGSNALGSIASEAGSNKPGGKFEGAQNWWSHFVDTQQYHDYPITISGVPTKSVAQQYSCNSPGTFSCQCQLGPSPPPGPSPPAPPPPPLPKCKVGDVVPCPGDPQVNCEGEECCPDGSVCPSAPNDWLTYCPTHHKEQDCTTAGLEDMMEILV
eukprot:gnl/MRDRNA2_/MRDRNA2_57118_c0_seq1.p1 gnl/MRDRNA2_/MRDRNA2_57118_c0~~gnl/MRDRNA2_/MRDRNA2_57118_c0_seq1.p1  ORF type:complete len:585 (+),score=99.89 gnl/MRDRNA2_/MRDRNA2_57118_c0_seq1:248-1756(+)